jgi:hypothetical protein
MTYELDLSPFSGIPVEFRWNSSFPDCFTASATRWRGCSRSSCRPLVIEKEMQEQAPILEYLDRRFLPPALAKQLDGDGRARTQQRFLELRRLVELS